MSDSVEFLKNYFPSAQPFAVASEDRLDRRLEVYFDRADIGVTYVVVSNLKDDHRAEPVSVLDGDHLHELRKQTGFAVGLVRIYDDDASAVRMRLSSVDIVRDRDGTASTILRREDESAELPVVQGRAVFIRHIIGDEGFMPNDQPRFLAEAILCGGAWKAVSPALESFGLIAATPETYFRSHFEYYRTRDDKYFWSANAFIECWGDYDRKFALLKILVERSPLDADYFKYLGGWGEDLMSERFLEDVEADHANRQKWAAVVAESICSGQPAEIQLAAARWVKSIDA